MLAKLTAKNQLTLPAEIVRSLPATQYFDATVEEGAIVLRPVRVVSAVDLDALRAAVRAVADEADIPDALAWARRASA